MGPSQLLCESVRSSLDGTTKDLSPMKLQELLLLIIECAFFFRAVGVEAKSS